MREGGGQGSDPQADSVAVVSMSYGHETRELAKQLTRTYHQHRDLPVARFMFT